MNQNAMHELILNYYPTPSNSQLSQSWYNVGTNVPFLPSFYTLQGNVMEV